MFKGKAWRADEFGTPKEVLRLQETTWDEPTEGRLLVRVSTCGIGLPDVYITGGSFPFTQNPPAAPGQEVVGEVVAAPPGARFSVGDRVVGFTPFLEGLGGLGEYAYCWEDMTRLVPTPLSDEEAAGFLLAFKTAHHGLVARTTVRPGDTLLVLGASGSSGSAAIQLGKALGATVIAGASSDEKLAFCRSVGADHTVNYKTSADFVADVHALTDGRGVDIIYDPLGGETATEAIKTLAQNGRLALVGNGSGSFPTIDPMALLLGNLSVVGVLAGAFSSIEENRAAVDHVIDLAERGKVKTPLGTVYSFDQVPDAIQRMADGTAIGKTVVRVAD